MELLRRWLVQNKPLARVQQGIDFVQPAAENLFQAAYAFYQAGQLEQALSLLRQVVVLNPNHVRGTQILSDILFAQKELEEAQLEQEVKYLEQQMNLNRLPPLNRFLHQPPALLTWCLVMLVIIMLSYILSFSFL